MGLADLADLLKASMGLNVASIGSAAIDRAVQERLAVCGLSDPEAYLERVRSSTIELQGLIEAVVVAESWFFRDRQAFAALARLAVEDWLPRHPEGVLSLLSLPCAAGEEPYSMAMALLDAGVAAARFRIDAIDISARNLALANRAVYGRNSFRGQELGFRARNFDAMPDGFHLQEAVRQPVRFAQGNLFAADLLPGAGRYDAIFCRNVLIYFDRATQDRALGVLHRLLHPKGVLFVAPAETGLPVSHGFVSTREPLAFAFRKAGVLPPVTARTAAPPPAARKPAFHVKAAVGPASPRAQSPVIPTTKTAPIQPTTSADLSDAVHLADQGHFAEAATRCETHLRRSGPSAPAFYLLGLLRDATGNHAEAVSYYRKALYLEPDHYDSQIHLALLLEKGGNPAAAQVLRDRAHRLEQRRKAASDA